MVAAINVPRGMVLLGHACAYITRDWPVFPVEPGGKRPLGRLAANGLYDASTQEAALARWSSDTPTANIGLVTGHVSGFFVVDVDKHHRRRRVLVEAGPGA